MESRIVNVDTRAADYASRRPADDSELECPRCGSLTLVILEKLGNDFNNCYRCYDCWHVFSPRSRQ